MDVVIPSVIYGLVFSALSTAIAFGGAAAARDFGVHDYPPEIQMRYGPKSERDRRVTAVVGVLIALLVGIALTACLLTVRSRTGESLDFVTAFASAEIVLMTFNLYDLLVLDWLLFNTIRPGIVVLPGTEGMAEYGDRAFHARGFARGVAIVSILALLAAGIAVVLESIL